MTTPAILLDATTEVARLAGNVALAHFRTDVVVDVKADGSPVTVADRAAETAARDWIDRRFASHAILGEEFGGSAATAGLRWIIDPIDGTKSFIRGVPLWGALVAVCEGETVIAGAAFFPALDEMLAAAIGEGCWYNNARTSVSTTATVADATVLTSDERFTGARSRVDGWRRLSDAAAVSRSWGDCYGYLLVATGRADVMVDGVVAPWDIAAVERCIIEAGGVFTDWEGRATAFGGSAIATNAILASEARELLR